MQRANAALALDPFNAVAYQEIGDVLYQKRDYSAATTALRKSISIDPGINDSHHVIGLIELIQGRPKEALKEFVAEGGETRNEGTALVSYGLGKRAESDAALARAINESGKTQPYAIARIYAYRGETNQAFDWLEKAYGVSDVDLSYALGDPYMAPLRDDPRWLALMRKMNLAK